MINTKPLSRKAAKPQTEIAREDQVKNNAGGFVFQVTPWDSFRRFLILGVEGGTYYVTERDLTKQSYDNVKRCIKEDGRRAVNLIVDISDKALAPKNDPAIFALALCAAADNLDTRQYALENLNKVCRISTHLFHFAEYVNAFRGWGRGLKTAISKWYLDKTGESLAYQAIKYQSRDGWSHRDLLRLSHPISYGKTHNSVLRWMVAGKDGLGKRKVIKQDAKKKEVTKSYPNAAKYLPAVIYAFEEAKTADTNKLINLIIEHDLPREAIPTEKLNDKAVWEALLEKMPITAMIRNLGKMTSIGLLGPLSKSSKKVISALESTELLKKGRVHPMAILIAAKIYGQGHGDKGSLSWTPTPAISQALDEAFYLSYGAVTPTGKSLLFGLDVSGSMGSPISGSCLTCCEGSTALALIHANVEKDYHIMAFDQGFRDLPIRKGMRLEQALKYTRAINGGGTDCSLPARWALDNKVDVGGIVILTDNETWAGPIHPFQAIKAYRSARVSDCRQVVIGMATNDFTIADPTDKFSMDVVGFDASAPTVISDFIRG